MVFCGLDPSPQLLGRFLLGPPYPLLGFAHYCSPNLRKLKGKNKGPPAVSSSQYHLLHCPKTCPGEITSFLLQPL